MRSTALPGCAPARRKLSPDRTLAWLLALSPVTVAIPGTGRVAHLEENIAAGEIVFTEEDLCDLLT